MSKEMTLPPLPAGNARITGAAIGSLSTFLVIGLKLLGVLEKIDLSIAKAFSDGKIPVFAKSLPQAVVWSVTFICAFAIAFAILHVADTWRRIMLWLTALVLIVGWAPVLTLAAHTPNISAPFVATLWSGFCALVYAGNHRMPCDLQRKDTPNGPQ